MNHFHLFAHGETFSPDSLLATTMLRPDHIWRRGEPLLGYEDIEGLPGHKTSGVEFVLGDGRAIPYPAQEKIALDFIAARRDGLRALGEFPGAEHFILMFQYEREFDGESDYEGGCVWASRGVMRAALDIGCEITFTFGLKRRDSDDELRGCTEIEK